MKITVFTPTYNRAYIIGNLYRSLCEQSYTNFEWLVVDDGSNDNTGELVQSFIDQNRLNIRYICKKNGGKHSAINLGAREARGELFFIVDSDDFLTPQALERISYHYEQISGKTDFAGVCGCRYYPSGERVGGNMDFNILECNMIDLQFKYKIKGDMAEVFKTNILLDYPFPEIEGEKYIPPKIIWYEIARKYKLRYFNENIYCCEYLKDGLTHFSKKNRMNSPRLSMLLYSSLYHMPQLPLAQRLAAALNYWRFSFGSNQSFREKVTPMITALVLMPFGLLLWFFDLWQIRK